MTREKHAISSTFVAIFLLLLFAGIRCNADMTQKFGRLSEQNFQPKIHCSAMSVFCLNCCCACFC